MPPRSKMGGGAYCVCPVCLWKFILAYEFEQWVLELWCFTWIFSVIWHFRWYHYFLLCYLDLDPFFENFNLANNFWTVSARAFIFLMNIPCDKIFLLVLNHIALTFDLFFKKKLTLVITSKKLILELSYCTWAFHLTRSSYLYQDICFVTVNIFGIGHYRGHLCFTNTSCFIMIFCSV